MRKFIEPCLAGYRFKFSLALDANTAWGKVHIVWENFPIGSAVLAATIGSQIRVRSDHMQS
jgi:hypothetical protein